MIISFEKEIGETKIYIKIEDKKENFEYFLFLNYIFLGKDLENIVFSEEFSLEEKEKLTNMIKNINKSTVKNGDLAKDYIYK